MVRVRVRVPSPEGVVGDEVEVCGEEQRDGHVVEAVRRERVARLEHRVKVLAGRGEEEAG